MLSREVVWKLFFGVVGEFCLLKGFLDCFLFEMAILATLNKGFE